MQAEVNALARNSAAGRTRSRNASHARLRAGWRGTRSTHVTTMVHFQLYSIVRYYDLVAKTPQNPPKSHSNKHQSCSGRVGEYR